MNYRKKARVKLNDWWATRSKKPDIQEIYRRYDAEMTRKWVLRIDREIMSALHNAQEPHSHVASAGNHGDIPDDNGAVQ